ncbi:MAG: ribosome small subunit-dependent GTPase A, partial [Rhodocyclaceae bacterium]|nr:ribosome small subunit-dependent GTPase A [Rhodocyclaceae bacterium]
LVGSEMCIRDSHGQMRAVIVLNKCDLTALLPAARQRLTPFSALDLPIVELSAQCDATPLAPWLAGELSVLVGQSGMGKSTLVNALVPGARAATREISTALGSGKHTTTHARLFDLPAGGGLIDSPGLQAFGLAHLGRGQIELGFAEFAPYLGQCRFRDCRHENEPDCAIKAAVAAGAIDARRLAHFHAIARESEQARSHSQTRANSSAATGLPK